VAFTYDISTERGQVRFYVGDTDSTDPLLEDAEVDFLLDAEGSVKAAAIAAAETIAAEFSRLADKSVGDLSISQSQKAAQYFALAEWLRRAMAKGALLYFGGISKTTKETREADTDRVDPAFTVAILDDPQVSESNADAEDNA
jgi:hypothetical protein